MLKISSALKEITENQPFLTFGLKNRLFNLSKLANFLKPLIEIRTKKEIKKTALQMNLSRLQKNIQSKFSYKDSFFSIENLNVSYNLCAVTFSRKESTFKEISQFYLKNSKKYFTLTQGTREITLIMNEDLLGKLKKSISTKPNRVRKNLSSLGVQFDPKYLETPGLLHYLIQQVSLQNINIEEMSSSDTELIFYLKRKDMSVAFNSFSRLVEE